MSKETGGPASPCTDIKSQYARISYTGLSIRDHFAGLAMQALIPRGYTPEETAQYAYTRADAMLKERNKP